MSALKIGEELRDYIAKSLNESRDALDSFLNDSANIESIEKAAKRFIATLKTGNTIYSCGNGGSMSDAMHFAEELTGRYRNSRAPLSAAAISDPGHITCVANDFGFEHIFSRNLEANSRKGDCLLAISTSGGSKNVIRAAEYAKQNDSTVVSLTGQPNSELGSLATIDISVGTSRFPDKVQELHVKVIHILIELIERAMCPENY